MNECLEPPRCWLVTGDQWHMLVMPTYFLTAGVMTRDIACAYYDHWYNWPMVSPWLVSIKSGTWPYSRVRNQPKALQMHRLSRHAHSMLPPHLPWAFFHWNLGLGEHQGTTLHYDRYLLCIGGSTEPWPDQQLVPSSLIRGHRHLVDKHPHTLQMELVWPPRCPSWRWHNKDDSRLSLWHFPPQCIGQDMVLHTQFRFRR